VSQHAPPSVPPEQMSADELMRYVKMLENHVVFLNSEVKKTEANAVLTIAAMAHVAGGAVDIPMDIIPLVQTLQFARLHNVETNTVEFRAKPTEPEAVEPVVEQPGG
jgi:hypothetical protein